MRRLLIVGNKVSNFPSIEWNEWSSANPLDYQGLVLDCRKLGELPAAGVIAMNLGEYINSGHTAYLILPEASAFGTSNRSLSLLPGIPMAINPSKGETLQIAYHEELFEKYVSVLKGYEIYMQPQVPQHLQNIWINAIVNNLSKPVCAKVYSIYLLHPPAKGLEQKAFKIIIEHFKPDPPITSSQLKPDWVDRAASGLPGVAELQAVRHTVQDEIEKKTDELRLNDQRLLDLAAWVDLLWQDGIPLQTRVGEALTFLGLSTKADDPTAHAGDLTSDESGVHYVFEVTGSNGSIGIEKGRQLLQWVSDAPDPNTAKGVLVANAFRNQAPDKRPPTPDHKIFVAELEAFAKKYHLGLLDTTELYRLVCLKLAGKPIDKAAVLAGLSTDGIVRFLAA